MLCLRVKLVGQSPRQRRPGAGGWLSEARGGGGVSPSPSITLPAACPAPSAFRPDAWREISNAFYLCLHAGQKTLTSDAVLNLVDKPGESVADRP